MTEPEPTKQARFDVAVSFAGEDRALVDEIVGGLKEGGLQVFYDDDFKVESWGKDLIEYFSDVYEHQARFAVMFISRHYAEKIWTRHERRVILSRAMKQRAEYVLPVRLDDTTLEGLLDTVGYLDARREGVAGIVQAALSKAGATSDLTDSSEGGADEIWQIGVPTSEVDTQALLALRPPGWEYLYYSAALLRGRAELEPQFYDVESGYAPFRTRLDAQGAYEYLTPINDRYIYLANQFNLVLDSSAQERAFGAPGEPGDPDRIQHLARQLLRVYSDFLSIVQEVRGTIVPDEWSRARDLIANFGVRPAQDMRDFFTAAAEEVSGIPQAVARGEEVNITMTAAITVDERIGEEFVEEFTKAVESLYQ